MSAEKDSSTDRTATSVAVTVEQTRESTWSENQGMEEARHLQDAIALR